MTTSRYASKDPISPAQAAEFARLEVLESIVNWENINQDKVANELHGRWYDAMFAVFIEKTFDEAELGSYQYDFDLYFDSVLRFAGRGHVDAQYNLYLFYLTVGEHEDANLWLKKAASNGHYQARFNFIKLLCVGSQVSSVDVSAAQLLVNEFFRYIQEEYFIALAEDNSLRVSSFKSLYEQMRGLNSQLNNLLSIPVLKTAPALEYLVKKTEVDGAITALNNLTQVFHSHISAPSAWIAANCVNNETEQRLFIRENSSAPLRPMIKLEFKVDVGMSSVTDNFLFKLLVIKMKLKFNGFSSVGALFRACILSVEDPELLKQIPELCSIYMFQPIAAKPSAVAASTLTSTTLTSGNLSLSVIHEYSQSQITQPKPDDSLIDKKRRFLLELKTAVNNPKWNNKAIKLTFFGPKTTTPDQIEAMRNILRNVKSETSAATVEFMLGEVKKLFTDYTAKITRDADVDDLYSRIIGRINLLSGKATINLTQTLRK